MSSRKIQYFQEKLPYLISNLTDFYVLRSHKFDKRLSAWQIHPKPPINLHFLLCFHLFIISHLKSTSLLIKKLKYWHKCFILMKNKSEKCLVMMMRRNKMRWCVLNVNLIRVFSWISLILTFFQDFYGLIASWWSSEELKRRKNWKNPGFQL